MPHLAASSRSRIAFADARHARRRRTAAVAAGGISGARSEIVRLDLGRGIGLGGDWRLRSLHGLCRTFAAAIGTEPDSAERVF